MLSFHTQQTYVITFKSHNIHSHPIFLAHLKYKNSIQSTRMTTMVTLGDGLLNIPVTAGQTTTPRVSSLYPLSRSVPRTLLLLRFSTAMTCIFQHPTTKPSSHCFSENKTNMGFVSEHVLQKGQRDRTRSLVCSAPNAANAHNSAGRVRASKVNK